MGRADAMIAKVNKILAATNSFTRQVYLRTTVNTGGDSLTGRYSSSSYTDELMTPQPFVQRLSRQSVSGGRAESETFQVGSSVKTGDDYLVMVSSTMVTSEQLLDPAVQFVFKDSSGAEEVVMMRDHDIISIYSTDVSYSIYCRSVKNQ